MTFQLPPAEELENLRKGLPKKRIPHAVDGMWLSEAGLGGAAFFADGKGLRVEWVAVVSENEAPRKKASFRELCIRPDLAAVRLEVGWLISEVMQADYIRTLHSIPGPKEAMRAAAPILTALQEWRHWALVPPGHMEGLD
jgi:hypothetical protein